jgi:acyl carrier protein
MADITIADFRSAWTEFTKRPVPDVTGNDTLASLQLDSLAMLEIIGQLEDKFGVEIDEDHLVDLKTVDDLLRIMNNAAKR